LGLFVASEGGCGGPSQGDKDAAIPCQEPTDCPVGYECVDTDGGLFCRLRPDAGPLPDSSIGIPSLTVSATELDFGAPLLGIPVSQELTLGNVGTGELLITELQILEDDLTDEFLLDAPPERPLVIAPGASRTIAVTLNAADAEEDRGFLLLGTNDVQHAAVLVRLTSSNKGTPVLEVCVNEEPDPIGPLVTCASPRAFDYGLVPYGGSAVRLARLRNINPGNAVLSVEEVSVPAPPAVPAQLFVFELFTLAEDPLQTGSFTEEPATLPHMLAPQQASDDLYLRVSFSANVDRSLESMIVSVRTLGASDLVTEVPILWQVDGCPPGYLDLSPAIPGCEYACPVWPSRLEQCNDLDDDCDGQVDEDFDKSSDPGNCGYCGHQCLLPHASSDCQNSLCVIVQCESSGAGGWANVNGDPADGCEYPCPVWPASAEACNDLDDDCDGQVDEDFNKNTDPQNCGTCGNDCLAQGKVCIEGKCELTCPLGTTNCGGSCVNLANDPANCGECGRVCGFPNAQASCISSTCMMGPCVAGNRDLDGLEGNGCEYTCPVWPTAEEVCNELDDDCDGQTDEGVKSTFYGDSDGDVYGDAMQTVQACSPPQGYVVLGTDCDDQNDAAYPGAPEVCDGVDNNCNGVVDEGVQSVFYRDADADGYGDVTSSVQACGPPLGYVAIGGDCDDDDDAIHPAAAEVCDGVDNNCNGVVDEGVQSVFYRDADADGYGSFTETIFACSAPSGYVSNGADCDDDADAIHPAAVEVCDGVDNNCNGIADEGVLLTFYRDGDADGHGDAAQSVQACSQPAGHSALAGDCDDYDDAIHPGAAEVCDGVDNNCNGLTDELFDKQNDPLNCGECGTDCTTMFPNASGICVAGSCQIGFCDEGWRDDPAISGNDCAYQCPVWPTQAESCNGLDDDCDAQVDESFDFVNDPSHCGGCNQRCADLFPNAQVECVESACRMVGCLSSYYDLDPGDPGCEYQCPTNPPSVEVCNGKDDDCDGDADEGYDLLNDPLNCGACGVVVGPGQICCAGVPTGSDESNCGQCGRSCPVGVSCFGGSCIEPGIIVITELQINPEAVADSLGEWLEIFNTTGYDINLRGWVLKDDGADSHTINDDVIVPSLGYAVLGLNSNYSSNGGVSIDYQYSSFDLGNSDGDEVVLLAGGQEVDRVVFLGTFDVAGKSKELSRNHIDDLANDTLTNWCTAVNQLPSGDYGTPGWANDCAL
jgi:hypothetical protein